MNVFILDRFEGEMAVLEGEDGLMRNVSKSRLPEDARQGDVFLEENGRFRFDAAAAEARRKKIREKLRRLLDGPDNPDSP